MFADTPPLSAESVEDLRKIHFDETGEHLTDEEAWEMATRLLELGRLLLNKSHPTITSSSRIKKPIPIANIEKQLKDRLEYKKFLHVTFLAPEYAADSIITTVTLQDSNNRRGAKTALKAVITLVEKVLSGTNWRADSYTYKLGVVSFRLVGSEFLPEH